LIFSVKEPCHNKDNNDCTPNTSPNNIFDFLRIKHRAEKNSSEKQRNDNSHKNHIKALKVIKRANRSYSSYCTKITSNSFDQIFRFRKFIIDNLFINRFFRKAESTRDFSRALSIAKRSENSWVYIIQADLLTLRGRVSFLRGIDDNYSSRRAGFNTKSDIKINRRRSVVKVFLLLQFSESTYFSSKIITSCQTTRSTVFIGYQKKS